MKLHGLYDESLGLSINLAGRRSIGLDMPDKIQSITLGRLHDVLTKLIPFVEEHDWARIEVIANSRKVKRNKTSNRLASALKRLQQECARQDLWG